MSAREYSLQATQDPSGSQWRRWDPHIHMPGTKKNDQFGARPAADEAWRERVLAWQPKISALGVTDYYVTDCYERAREWQAQGLLPGIDFIFPNVELRFAVNAPKGSPINVHLLVSPDDRDHLEQLDDFLAKLTFHHKGENYGCDRRGLIKLGRAFMPSVHGEEHALKVGIEQHKVSPDNLIASFAGSAWARKNIIVALSGSSSDGSGQLRDDGLAAMRRNLERTARVIFSGNAASRAFWLGEKADDIDAFKIEYDGLKPCMQGCDAHKLEEIGDPAFKRFTWLKGDPTFETLRQACIEPHWRAHIGEVTPETGLPSNTVASVKVSSADWVKPPEIPINPGLVAIIGARGSGKTALLELIAAGAHSIDKANTERSFLERARPLVGSAQVQVKWGGGPPTSSTVDFEKLPEKSTEARACYLSQKFVDKLCSSDGLATELRREIERVIFNAHDLDDRLDASNFEELQETKSAPSHRAKRRYEQALLELARELSAERELSEGLAKARKERDTLRASIERDKADRKALAPSDDAETVKLLDKVRLGAEAKRQRIGRLQKQVLDLEGLSEELAEFGGDEGDLRLRQLKTRYPDAGFAEGEWALFSINYAEQAVKILDEKLKSVRSEIKLLQGPAAGEAKEPEKLEEAAPFFDAKADLGKLTLSLLNKELKRLEAKVGLDRERRQKYNDLSTKITTAETTLGKRDRDIEHAEAAPGRIAELRTKRQNAYRGVFNEIEKQEVILKALYQPLAARLADQGGALAKLTFSVRRIVDVAAWADAGEALFNLAKAGDLRGKGVILERALQELKPAWESGDAAAAADAMSKFRTKYGEELYGRIPDHAKKTPEAKRAWNEQVAAWLFDTDHIGLSYGLEYEGADIQQLSPGTRGIVLLLLYLSIDLDDERPLLIDQPEENLDPKSIFEELVDRFKEARRRRQIIIVTHNANLVINTDADQVIVAERGPHRAGKLPMLNYKSGGLENEEIRNSVCEILEGGRMAFEERARRLRLNIASL
jgi:ABC-type lipoprotein export system ATPase subunit